MNNTANVRMGVVAVSRDCFPMQLAQTRRDKLVGSCKDKNIDVTSINIVIENENDVLSALKEIESNNINALVVYLGNFGPEGPVGILTQKFDGPVMLIAAAEESGNDLIDGRGDAYCGLLNSSYNIGLRKLRPYIPHYPVGTVDELAEKIGSFFPVARIVLSLRQLKIFSFGPRPQDFLACNAPIRALYDLGVEVMENSELDLYDIYKSNTNETRIKAVVSEMEKELGQGNTYPDLLEKLARFEVALEDFMQDNLGASRFGIFANKCWPAFEKYFGFVPCFVNSRLAAKGIPVACEVDIYGALSEYITTCATQTTATILDINNTVPADMYNEMKKEAGDYKNNDLFMGFHCGNTSSGCMMDPRMKYQLIMHRLQEPDKEPDITRGTLEGRIKPGDVTMFRLQSTADTRLCSYIAQGEILDIDPKSFGSIAVFGIKEMARFYRYVLIEKRFPHHSSIGFKHSGNSIFSALKMLGVDDIYYNKPAGDLYDGENPFA